MHGAIPLKGSCKSRFLPETVRSDNKKAVASYPTLAW
jgi:hypothetical protein